MHRQFAASARDKKAPLGRAGPRRRANQHKILAVPVTLRSAVLPALLATLAALLAALAGVLGLLAGLVLATALLLPGLLLAALVRVLRILAHRFLLWAQSQNFNSLEARNVPQCGMGVVTVPPTRGA